MILYIKNPKNSTKNTTRTNKFSKVSQYKINKQKYVAFLYNNKVERAILKNPYTIALKRLNFLGINLTKDVIDL